MPLWTATVVWKVLAAAAAYTLCRASLVDCCGWQTWVPLQLQRLTASLLRASCFVVSRVFHAVLIDYSEARLCQYQVRSRRCPFLHFLAMPSCLRCLPLVAHGQTSRTRRHLSPSLKLLIIRPARTLASEYTSNYSYAPLLLCPVSCCFATPYAARHREIHAAPDDYLPTKPLRYLWRAAAPSETRQKRHWPIDSESRL